MLTNKLMGGAGAEEKLYVDDVFSTYLYTGNGSTQTITNGIDLAGEGGLVWIKSRSVATSHQLFNTAMGATYELISNSTATQTNDADTLTAFNSTGFALGADSNTNTSTATYASWTFRKAPKFFDVQTATLSSGNATISFSDLVTLGMVIVRRTDSTGDWYVWHRSASSGKLLYLNSTAAGATLSHITVSGTTLTLVDGTLADGNYICYGFAHDTEEDGMIQCGSYSGNQSLGINIELGWEPQYLMIKRTDTSGNWNIFDTMRGLTVSSVNAPALFPNSTGVESGPLRLSVGATGFYTLDAYSDVNINGGTYIYLAIRRPNKPPTSGTEVYVPSTGSGVITTGFPVDLHLSATLAGAATNHRFHSRMQGGTKELVSCTTAAESTVTDLLFDSNTGLRTSFASGLINHFFRRAPGFFDVVCYTGTGSAMTVAHSLGVAPELIIIKSRSGPYGWPVYHITTGNTHFAYLNATSGFSANITAWNNTTPTETVFTVGTGSLMNTNAATYVTYLFATLAGISKVGSYTGNGTSQTINCGFSAGARFVLIKRTDNTGDWYVWDSVRGIVAANDPHLSLNTTAAEVTTDDSIDPDNSGFIVNQVAATNINVTSATYIFLAIA